MPDEGFGDEMMHLVRVGKGERLANVACQALPKRAIAPFPMRGLIRLFADPLMAACAEQKLVGMPEVTEGVALALALRHLFPQALETLRATVTHGVGHTLARAALERDPQPAWVRFVAHPGPAFIQVEHSACRRRRYRLAHGRQLLTLLPHPAADCRATDLQRARHTTLATPCLLDLQAAGFFALRGCRLGLSTRRAPHA